MAKFDVITLTERAADHVRDVMATAAGGPLGIRIGVKNGGCAGMEYTMDLVHEENSADDVVEMDGARVYIEPKAVLFLLGTEMDYEVTKLRAGFTFNNPNQVSACGCGESVTLQAADPAKLARSKLAH